MWLPLLLCLLTWTCCFGGKQTNHMKSKEKYEVCHSDVCKTRAKLLNESLDTSVEPCEDFYAYVCGGWMSRHTIPESGSSYSIFQMLDDELEETLKDVLENITLVDRNQTVSQKAATIFKACKEVPRAQDRRDVLADIMNSSGFAQWPVTAADTRNVDIFRNTADVLLDIGLDPILGLYIGRDVQKLRSHVIQIDQIGFPKLGRNQLVYQDAEANKPIINAYKQLVEVLVKFVRPDIMEGELSTLITELLEIQGQLAKITTPPEERRNLQAMYHRTSIGSLQKNFSNIPLLLLLNKKFSKANITLGKEEPVELYALDYYNRANLFLKTVRPETLFNYAGLRVALSWAADVSEKYRNASLEFSRVASGVKTEQPRWKSCVGFLNDAMRDVMGHLYAKERFSPAAKYEVQKLVSRIKEVFHQELVSNHWMDDHTRKAALSKLKKMGVKIGYPDEIMHEAVLEERFRYIPELDICSHFLVMWRILEDNNDIKWLQKLRLPYDRSSWVVGSAVVNAFYNPSTNEMLYPSGILQGLFYGQGLPSSLNIGAIGGVIGHEITHGFDDEGSQYDEEGGLRQWWSNDTRAKFDKKAKCFEQQYGKITDPLANMTLNGINTLGENIADNGGLRMAFKAYKKFGKDVRLPGLEHLSGRKLFFIGRAMTRCTLRRPESLKMYIQYNSHSPAQYRVNEPMKNMQAFSTVFNCKPGTPMNPNRKDTCTLW